MRSETGGWRRDEEQRDNNIFFLNNDHMGSILDFDHFWNGVSLTSRVPCALHLSFKSMKHSMAQIIV